MFTTRRFADRLLLAVVVALLSLAGPTCLAQSEEPPQPEAADRVVLRFAEGQFELLSVTPFDTFLPASDSLPGELGSVSGFWYELQASDGSVRYRRIIGDPIRLVFEGPEQEAAMPLATKSARVVPRMPKHVRDTKDTPLPVAQSPVMRQQPSERMKQMMRVAATAVRDEAVPDERVFSVVVPRAEAGEQLVLFSSPLEPGAQAGPADEVGRVTLGEVPQ